jgi:hypothetical protein
VRVVLVLLQLHAAQVHEGILVFWATGGSCVFLVEYNWEFALAIAAVMEEVFKCFIDGHEGDQSLPSCYRELPADLQAKWDMLGATVTNAMQRVQELPLSGASSLLCLLCLRYHVPKRNAKEKNAPLSADMPCTHAGEYQRTLLAKPYPVWKPCANCADGSGSSECDGHAQLGIFGVVHLFLQVAVAFWAE